MSDAPRVVVEPISRMPVWKRIGALIYGLALLLGIVFVIRGELVEKFGLPLRLHYTPPVKGIALQYSIDDGATWADAELLKASTGRYGFAPRE